MTSEPKNGYLPRKMFLWIMGVVVLAISGLFGFMFTLSNIFNHNVTEIKVDIGKIQTDLGLLRKSLDK